MPFVSSCYKLPKRCRSTGRSSFFFHSCHSSEKKKTVGMKTAMSKSLGFHDRPPRALVPEKNPSVNVTSIVYASTPARRPIRCGACIIAAAMMLLGLGAGIVIGMSVRGGATQVSPSPPMHPSPAPPPATCPNTIDYDGECPCCTGSGAGCDINWSGVLPGPTWYDTFDACKQQCDADADCTGFVFGSRNTSSESQNCYRTTAYNVQSTRTSCDRFYYSRTAT